MTIYSLDILLSQPEWVHCPMSSLTVASCSAYRFLTKQVMWSGIPIFWRVLQFVVIHTVKCVSIVSETKLHVFLKFSSFICDLTDAGNLISGYYPFSKSSLNMKFSVHMLLKPSLENFAHYFAIMWNECNHALVWRVFDSAFLWNWNENWPFPVLWPLLSFPNLLAYWVQPFQSIIFEDLK